MIGLPADRLVGAKVTEWAKGSQEQETIGRNDLRIM
jgi:hypothetical protein